jgi:hypothetical protein
VVGAFLIPLIAILGILLLVASVLGHNLLGEPSPDPITAALEDLFLDSKGDPEDIGSRLDRHGKGDRAVTAHY